MRSVEIGGSSVRHRAIWRAALALAAAICIGSGARAAVVSCPGTPATTDREFILTTTPGATCLASASGNINGNGDAINALGYTTLDKSDDNTTGLFDGALVIVGSGTTGGTFSFTPPPG